MAITSVKDRYNELIKAYQPSITDAIKKSNAAYKQQSDTVSNMYQTQIGEQEQQYDKLFDQNEVQRYINEQRVAEDMANRGLTDSGLNRTQQTAVQLSYANNNSEIGRQLQSAVDALTQATAAKLADIESARSSAEMNIKSGYEKSAMEAAQKAYNADVAAQTALRKARISAAAKSSGNGGSGNSSSGNLYTFLGEYSSDPSKNSFRDSKGKIVYVTKGLNPYTSSNNIAGGIKTKTWESVKNTSLSPQQKASAVYGVFSNGYQPMGVVFNGNNYGQVYNANDTVDRGDGTTKNVWKTTNGGTRYWIWEGISNTYTPVTLKNGEWIETKVK